MSVWLFVVIAVAILGGIFLAGFIAGTRHARVPKLPPRLADPPEPKVDVGDDWWRE